jgi:hypothetical protein
MDAQDVNNPLDKIIRSKVNDLRPTFQAGSWDRLSARLDEAEAADAFDQEMAQRLQRMDVPYQSNSWAILAERLELERRRVQAVVHYKIMEVSLLLLLFITAWQQLPITPTSPVPVTPTPAAGLPFAALTPAEDRTVLPIEAPAAVHGQSTLGEDKNNNASSTNILADQDADQSAASNLIASVLQVKDETEARSPILNADLLPTTEIEGIPYEKDAQQQLKRFFAQKTEDLNSPSDAFQQQGALAALDGGETPLLDYGDPTELLGFIRPLERKTFLRIGFVGSPDYNRVITPSQVQGDGSVIGYDRYSLGYSGGLTLGIEHGKWEIETGASYAARRYQTVPTIYVTGSLRDGYTGLGLRDFELNTVNIPLDFRYNVLLKDKWRVYTQAGASLNLVLDANYFLSDQEAFTGVPNANLRTGGNSAAEKPEPLLNKALTAGWLEGGSFWDNATLYANFGLGLERYMTPNWSMFVQPTYRHSLPLFNNGLGPYDDVIHNFGIGMGVKVRL